MAAIKFRVVKIEHVDGAPWDGLQKYLSCYYAHIERYPEIKASLEKNIEVAEAFYGQYVTWLAKFPEADTEDNRELYRKQIDYLTRIYTKREKLRQASENKKAVFNKVMGKV